MEILNKLIFKKNYSLFLNNSNVCVQSVSNLRSFSPLEIGG